MATISQESKKEIMVKEVATVNHANTKAHPGVLCVQVSQKMQVLFKYPKNRVMIIILC